MHREGIGVVKVSMELLVVNPRPARPAYIRFQADYKLKDMSLKLII